VVNRQESWGEKRGCPEERRKANYNLFSPINSVAVRRGMTTFLPQPQQMTGRSAQVKSIQIHHLMPSRNKVFDEFLLAVSRCIDFRQGTQL